MLYSRTDMATVGVKGLSVGSLFALHVIHRSSYTALRQTALASRVLSNVYASFTLYAY